MKKIKVFSYFLVMFLFLPLAAIAEEFSPVVSTDWLQQNLDNPKLIIVDIRKVEDYRTAHIPGAISLFYGTWAIKKGDIDNQLPEDDELVDILSSAGIGPDSIVVVAGATESGPDRVNATRVAWTLKYAGVKTVGILDGGHTKWIVREKRTVSTDVVKPKAKPYRGTFNKNLLASKDYVASQLGKVLIVDVREPEFFAGRNKLPFVAKAGRIAGAVNLPTAQVFDKYPPGEHLETCCYTLKPDLQLKNMASGVVGNDLSREIIVYCDTGRVASMWWFILHEVLGYKNVRNYDGSMQEWSKDPNAKIEP
jgi:thiosulfate/3-mercaptopyruvate sulfurtransferase